MNRRNYILAGNHHMLDELYAEKRQLALDNAALSRDLNAYKAAFKRVRPIAQKREDVIAALKQADDTLSWAQHFINHADKQSIPATIEQIRSVLAAIE